ncbi:TraG family conjugative transposon ATPase, partial [Bacteroides xylanisolvens]
GEHLKTYHSNMERRWVLSLQHKILFPVVTVIIMEAFINKMRRLHGVRKMIVVEEAWKAIAREGMADYIKFLCAPVKVAS